MRVRVGGGGFKCTGMKLRPSFLSYAIMYLPYYFIEKRRRRVILDFERNEGDNDCTMTFIFSLFFSVSNFRPEDLFQFVPILW